MSGAVRAMSGKEHSGLGESHMLGEWRIKVARTDSHDLQLESYDLYYYGSSKLTHRSHDLQRKSHDLLEPILAGHTMIETDCVMNRENPKKSFCLLHNTLITYLTPDCTTSIVSITSQMKLYPPQNVLMCVPIVPAVWTSTLSLRTASKVDTGSYMTILAPRKLHT